MIGYDILNSKRLEWPQKEAEYPQNTGRSVFTQDGRLRSLLIGKLKTKDAGTQEKNAVWTRALRALFLD